MPRTRTDPCTLNELVGRENFEMIVEALSEGEFEIVETFLRAENGREIPVTLKGSTYVTESGRVLHLLIASDKSDFYKMMTRIREVQDQLTHSARLASLGEMAAGIGHELTQPLNAILLLSRNCLKALQNPEKNRLMLEENLSIIIDRVNKASSIINSLKSFATKARDNMVPVNINAILLDILKFFESQLTLSDIGLDLRLDTQHTIEVMGQEVKLEQVFFNLIQNAILSMGKTAQPQLTISTGIEDSINPTTLKEEPYRTHCRPGQRRGDLPRHPGKDLRSLLHYPRHRFRHGPRPVDRRPDRPGLRRLYQGRQCPGQRGLFYRISAGPPGRRPDAVSLLRTNHQKEFLHAYGTRT